MADAKTYVYEVYTTHLDTADVLGLLAEALAAHVEAVLADQAALVGAGAAARCLCGGVCMCVVCSAAARAHASRGS